MERPACQLDACVCGSRPWPPGPPGAQGRVGTTALAGAPASLHHPEATCVFFLCLQGPEA